MPTGSGPRGGVTAVVRDTVSLPSFGVVSAVKAGAFWGAILLPFVYLPVLATGLDDPSDRLLVVSLLSLNVVLLVVGHTHRT